MVGKPRIDKTYKRIVAHIREAISSGELRAGDRLPPETELARQLGVSRPTVREALKALEMQNVLSSSTGPTGGTFVNSFNGLGVAEYLRDSISLLLDVDELTLEELWAAREVIDIPVVGLAAIRRTEQDLLAIKKTIEMKELTGSDYIVSDISFHRAVAEASKNRILSLFTSSIHMTIRTLAERYIVPEDVPPEVRHKYRQQHQLIYEAISNKDEASARIRMQDHLQFLMGSIGNLLHTREP